MTHGGPGPLEGEDEVLAGVLAGLAGRGGALRLPAGHDCAVVEVDGASVVVTTDALVDGVHFDLAACGAEAAGAKSLLVNLSDLAAAAAVPVAFEVAVVLPRAGGRRLLDGLARGLSRVARRHACPCAGGDTNVADAPLTIAVTAIGRPGPGGVVTRGGAAVGDELSVTGPLGGAGAARHLDFVPRLAEAQVLAARGIPHAMMDLSDGLSRDLPRLCRMSGVGAEIDARRVPVHPDAGGALARALDDGEDFELLLAHAPLGAVERTALEAQGVVLHGIGRVVPAAAGVLLRDGDDVRPLVARGYDHFLRDR